MEMLRRMLGKILVDISGNLTLAKIKKREYLNFFFLILGKAFKKFRQLKGKLKKNLLEIASKFCEKLKKIKEKF